LDTIWLKHLGKKKLNLLLAQSFVKKQQLFKPELKAIVEYQKGIHWIAI
jgi:hypothetical protein